jgi:hypothetical protein
MPVANPRTRLVSFRVSEHEYARLRTLSSTQGAHSLADFIRATVCWVMDCMPHGIWSAADGSALRLPFSDSKSQMPFMGMSADQTPQTPETLSGRVLWLQLKLESLDREVRRLMAMPHSVEPPSRSSVPEVRQQDTTPSDATVSAPQESGHGYRD